MNSHLRGANLGHQGWDRLGAAKNVLAAYRVAVHSGTVEIRDKCCCQDIFRQSSAASLCQPDTFHRHFKHPKAAREQALGFGNSYDIEHRVFFAPKLKFIQSYHMAGMVLPAGPYADSFYSRRGNWVTPSSSIRLMVSKRQEPSSRWH